MNDQRDPRDRGEPANWPAPRGGRPPGSAGRAAGTPPGASVGPRRFEPRNVPPPSGVPPTVPPPSGVPPTGPASNGVPPHGAPPAGGRIGGLGGRNGGEPELLTHAEGAGGAEPIYHPPPGPPPPRQAVPRQVPPGQVPGQAGPGRVPPPGRSAHAAQPTRVDPPAGEPGAGGPPGGVPPRRRGAGGSGGGSSTSGWRRFRKFAIALLVFGVFGPIVAFAVGWLIFPTPTPDDVSTSQVASVEYSDGTELTKIIPTGNVNRTKVNLQQVPKSVQYAVLSAEDRSFFSNLGFDPIGIARAAWNQLTGGRGGGSTITQQYIKITTGQDQYSLFRKYKEIVLAAKISKEYSKEKILEDYLNTIYLGRGAYGIQAASQAYFGLNSDQLNYSQGALLAGMIQSPSRWDPAKNPAKATERWNFVLDGMVAQRWLTPAERSAARFPQTVAAKPAAGGIPTDARGHIYTQIKNELESKGITENELNQEGLKITTTIDPALQKQAQQVAERVMKAQPANLRTALVSVDPKTGGILAYYGGENGVGLDYAQVLKQPGSSFKPFVMAAALEQPEPIGLGTSFDGSSPQTIAGQTVNNSEGVSCDNCSLKTAMTQSINTVFYHLAVEVGPAAVAKAAHQAGIPADLLPRPSAGIALGDKEVHPGDMAAAFATFAAEGVYHVPHMITKVETSDGRVLYDGGTDPGEQRMDAQVARNVTESMIDVARSSRIGLPDGRPVATKTGTVQSSIQGQNKDAWTVGYTPDVSTAVWVGTDDNSPIKTSGGGPIYGRMVPGSIWQQFMTAATRGKPKSQFSRFVPLGEPPDDSDATSSEDSDREDSEGRSRGDRDQDFDSEDCDEVLCDDDGNPIDSRDRRNRDRNDESDNGDN